MDFKPRGRAAIDDAHRDADAEADPLARARAQMQANVESGKDSKKVKVPTGKAMKKKLRALAAVAAAKSAAADSDDDDEEDDEEEDDESEEEEDEESDAPTAKKPAAKRVGKGGATKKGILEELSKRGVKKAVAKSGVRRRFSKADVAAKPAMPAKGTPSEYLGAKIYMAAGRFRVIMEPPNYATERTIAWASKKKPNKSDLAAAVAKISEYKGI